MSILFSSSNFSPSYSHIIKPNLVYSGLAFSILSQINIGKTEKQKPIKKRVRPRSHVLVEQLEKIALELL